MVRTCERDSTDREQHGMEVDGDTRAKDLAGARALDENPRAAMGQRGNRADVGPHGASQRLS